MKSTVKERQANQGATRAAVIDIAEGVGEEVGETNLDSIGLHRASN